MSQEGYRDDRDYLADALDALRLRCRHRIITLEEEGLVPRDPLRVIAEEHPNPEDVKRSLEITQTRIEARLTQTQKAPAFLALTENFKLNAFEQDLLLMALAPALDGTFNGLYGRLKGVNYRHHLDIDVALNALAGDFEDRIARRQSFNANGALLRHNLLLIGRGTAESGDEFLNLQLRLPTRLVALFLGHDDRDESLQGFSRLLEPRETLERVILPPQEKSRIVELVGRHNAYVEALSTWGLSDAIPYGRGIVMLFSGPSGTGKTLTARAVACHLERRLLLVDTSRLSSNAQRSFAANLDNLFREARLQRAVLFFDECEALFSAANRASGALSTLLQALEHFEGVCILATNLPQVLDSALDRRILYRVDFEVPTPTLREAIWKVHLPDELPISEEINLHYLARRFEFSGGYIKNAVLLAAGAAAARKASAEGPPYVTQDDLVHAAYTQLRHRLNKFAERDYTGLRLGDVVLNDEVSAQITEIIEAVSAQQIVFREWGFGAKFNKGRGLSALFDGDPGTGKTLCAEVIAAELGMNLYRVNVANIVSKYIGETEKNLTKVFAEARSAQSVLLFDEADSLFSKRVEVKHSNDRFANMEINVLLQLIERYDGLVILTTNLKTSIDKAFERRLSFKVNFPFPDAEMRAEIWERLLPERAPIIGELDYRELGACFELSGGSVKNAVLRAAYRAASSEQGISMELLEDAAKRECQAAGKLYRVPQREQEF